jgi:hypothetical protein
MKLNLFRVRNIFDKSSVGFIDLVMHSLAHFIHLNTTSIGTQSHI